MALTKVRGNGLGTLGDGTANDTKIVFDGNAVDYHIGLDDSADSLIIGKGSALGTTTSMSVDTNGFVLKPSTPGFSCTVGDGHSSTGNLTATAVTWGNIYHNFGSHLSGTTFTVPVTGRYFVTFGGIAGASSTSSAARMEMHVNGSVVSIQSRGEEGHSYSQMAASYLIQLTLNDACTVKILDRGMWCGGSDTTGTNDPHWSMYLLG